MKPTDFSKYISDFISRYLPHQRGATSNTITSYRDTFVLLIDFIQRSKRIKLEKISLDKIKKETIVDFLNWIQQERGCSNTTRNTRLAAIHAFYRFLQGENIDQLHECQRILSIKTKRVQKDTINYLTTEGVKLILQQPQAATPKGRRDLTLLSLMYDTGARVQEIIDLTPSMVKLNKPCTIKIIGKGNKARLVPMLDAQTEQLKGYLLENKLDNPVAALHPLFYNSRKEKLTRAGINHIIQKYCKQAREKNKSLIPEKISCHSLRHSKAMHLLQAGVNIVYIRDILGHVSVQTTEIYARVDSKLKRMALEKAYINMVPTEKAMWTENDNLITWLKKF